MTAPSPVALHPALGKQLKMSDDAFRQIREHIYDLTGIYFQDNKKYLLEGRLGKRLQLLGLSAFEEYFQFVKFGARRNDELKHLYDAVTINETFFFRNEPQFEAFEHTLVPEILRSKSPGGKYKLRIWSAASSSGEEAYTLAMLYLERLKPKYPSLEIEIVGTDINSTVVDTARKGLYREYSIRNMPQSYLQKYFVSSDNRFQVKDNVRCLARFENLNLYDQVRMRQLNSFDIIFCCNVLIYFDAKSKIRVVSGLYNSLNRGGYLFIGYAESLVSISNAFKLLNFPKTVAYKKE
jgi:chemotaxis protein methyltransferase CheR